MVVKPHHGFVEKAVFPGDSNLHFFSYHFALSFLLQKFEVFSSNLSVIKSRVQLTISGAEDLLQNSTRMG